MHRHRFSQYRPAVMLGKMGIGQFDGFEVAYRIGSSDEDVISHSFANDIFFSGMPEYVPQLDDVVIDIGAHIGTFSLLAARNSPQGRVYAIEASLETFNYLKVNAALNSLANLNVFHLALADKKGATRLYHDDGNWGHTIMHDLSGSGEDVLTDTLANFMDDNTIERCDLLKFNCEGAEFPILMSAPDSTLKRVNKMLILYHLDLATQYRLPALLDKLTNNGFATTLRNESKERGWIIAMREG